VRDTVELVTSVVFVGLVGAAGIWDLRTRRIPNWLTAGSLLSALVLKGLAGPAVFWDGLTGAGLGLAVGLVLFALRALGGGDGKLMVAVGAFLGFERMPGALLAIGVLGGFLALGEAIRRRVILPSLYNAADMLRRWVTFKQAEEPRTIESPGAVTVPYGVAIAMGAIAWWFWGVPL
jgi:prepilin peptidase CpaA